MSCQPASAAESNRDFRFSLRSLFVKVAIVGVLLGCVAALDRHWFAPQRHSQQIRDTFESLATRRPPNVSRGSWNAAVGWILNLHANSLVAFQANDSEICTFQDELNDRLHNEEVNLNTIFWIWDQFAELTPAGNNYQRFREQMISDIENVSPNHQMWAGLNVP